MKNLSYREEYEQWIEAWINGNREEIIKKLRTIHRRRLFGFFLFMLNNCPEYSEYFSEILSISYNTI